MSCSDGAVNAYLDYEPNRAPQILDLQSDFTGLPVPGDIMTVSCETYDPDGNPLTYDFTSGQGSFTGQQDREGKSEITFVVGNISGGEEVTVSVQVTDSKNASAAATLNIGTSSLGPAITLLGSDNRTIGADGYSAVTFRSSMDGFYQVDLADSGITGDEIDPDGYFFFIQKNTDTVFNICGTSYSDNECIAGIPKLETDSANSVFIKVMDGMGQISVREIVITVLGTTPVVGNPEIRITDLKDDAMTLNWNFATDLDNPEAGEQQQGMDYSVYMSENDNISTLEDVESYGNRVMDWKADLNFFTVTGLAPSTTYYFNVVVMDGDGVKEVYGGVEGRTEERTYFQVISTVPAPDVTDVDINSKIVIAFNRELNEETVNEDTIVLKDTHGDEIPVKLSLSGSNMVIIVEPVDNLDYGMKYYMTVSSGMEDVQGDGLGDDYVFGFSTKVRCTSCFVTTWKTDNPGTSEDDQITIPVYSGETYDYSVDWGDGSSDEHLTGSATHTYDVPGIYTVSISGTFPRIYFFNSGDREKILTIESWGEIEWTSMASAFFGCSNLTYNATDAPNLSGVTVMNYMFYNALSLNGDFSGWDVSNVADMSSMFAYATSFNGDISSWDVSSVTNMYGMFWNATSFNRDLNNWDVKNVINMFLMFGTATSFNGNISGWDVSNVTNMSGMFESATSFNGDISNWDVSSVTNMYGMFWNATTFNGDISGWDVSNVTDMRLMFRNASTFSNHDLNGWDVSSVKVMSSMFNGASSFNGDISNWNVSNVKDMIYMFYNATSFNGDISRWDVSSVTDMYGMFRNATSFNGDISRWDVSNVKNMSSMFNGASSFNGDIINWNVNNVKNMIYMFNNAISFNRDINKWDVSSVTNMYGMFWGASTFNGDMSNWDVSNVTNMAFMFYNASDFNGDTSRWDVSNVIYMDSMFFGARSFNGDISGWDVSSVTDMSNMFYNAKSFEKDISDWDVSSVTNMKFMFFGSSSFNGDINGWDVSSVTNMNAMFAYATSFNRDISRWEVNSVKSMVSMFCGASSFNGDISSWNVSNVTDMNSMFYNATSFDKDISKWDVSSVTNMTGMFRGTTSFNGDISNWDVSSVINMSYMFYNASAFSYHNLSDWDVENVTDHTGFSTGWGDGNMEPEWP